MAKAIVDPIGAEKYIDELCLSNTWTREYFSIAKKRLMLSADSLSKFIKPGFKVLDIGGNDYFEKFLKLYFPFEYEYTYFNKNKLDIRSNLLPFYEDYFDIIISWETIEHLWTMDSEGLIGWNGIVNFWKECYRVLKYNGVFHLTTTNRFCPRCFSLFNTNGAPQIHCPTIWEKGIISGHARELSAEELRILTEYTKLFLNHEISSINCYNLFDVETEQFIVWKNKLEQYIGRNIKQEEMHDTLFFIGYKSCFNDIIKSCLLKPKCNDRVIYAMSCNFFQKYLEMAIVCIKSMRASGMNERVFVHTDNELSKNNLWFEMDKLNVDVDLFNIYAKQVSWDKIFDRYPDSEFIIYLDCDHYFNNYKLNLNKILNNKYDIQYLIKRDYENEFAIDVFDRRVDEPFWLANKKIINGSQKEHNFNALENVLKDYNFKVDKFRNFCKNRRWICGNIYVINRKILKTNLWEVLKKIGSINYDDELACMIGMYLCHNESIGLVNHLVDDYTGNINAISDKNFQKLIHYAGPINKVESFVMINKLLNQL